VSCNQTVKFADLLATARELDAAAMATGHYVRSRLVNGRRALFRPVDLDRDQSYFLFATTQAQLEFLRFPLGELSKDQTRAIARELGLKVAEKHDSQDICFVPQGRYSDVVEKLKPEAVQPGEIVHADGRVLGRHDGVIRYTVGQRRGLGIAAGEPLFVIRLDAANARVVVGPRAALATRSIALRDFNWLGEGELSRAAESGLPVFARVRSTRPPAAATLIYRDGRPVVDLAMDEMGVAPGQACVLYDGDGPDACVLGGGTIEARIGGAERAEAA
jgi:tRNA-specific 2-thiouridylase